jgi:hypothetical protein
MPTLSSKTPEQSFAKLRKKIERERDKYRALVPKYINLMVKDLGLDHLSGDGLALVKLLDGDPDREKAVKLMRQFGWEQTREPVPR